MPTHDEVREQLREHFGYGELAEGVIADVYYDADKDMSLDDVFNALQGLISSLEKVARFVNS